MTALGSNWRRRFVLAIPYAWLLLFFALPFAVIVRLSVSQSIVAQPPYAPQFDLATGLSGLMGAARQGGNWQQNWQRRRDAEHTPPPFRVGGPAVGQNHPES